MLAVLKDKRFAIFWSGNLVSAIGDQISLTAFPWLVLQLSGDPFLVGLALAVQGVPRAFLMLFGGAIADKFSPRKVMLWSSLGRMIAVFAVGLLLVQNQVTLPTVFFFALLFGLADAFYFPAANAIIPSLVKREDLQAANSLNQIVHQFALIVGPIIAAIAIAGTLTNDLTAHGTIITKFEDERMGLARAFLLDGATFLVAVFTLAIIRTRQLNSEEDADTPILTQVREALGFVWRVPAMRLAFLGVAFLEFFFQSPVFVGLPALSAQRYAEGAAAFAIMVASYGVGALIGGTISGFSKTVKPQHMVPLLFLLFGWSSLMFSALVLYEPLWFAGVALLTAGLTDGWVWVQFMTWIQMRTPEEMLGRVMSIFMLLSVGLLPIAHIVIGGLLSIALEPVFLIVSFTMCGASLIAAFHKDSRNLGSTGDDTSSQSEH